MKTLVLSVHQLVDFLLRKGDIDTRVFNRSSMTEGSKLHSWYQNTQTKGYISEYPLKCEIVSDDISVTIQGRADGIIHQNDRYIIDELKTTVIDIHEFYNENFEWHLGQAICYAYMFAREQKLDEMGIKLTYIRQGKEKERMSKSFSFKFIELENYVKDLVEAYLDFYNIVFKHIENRQQSLKDLSFPFDNFRKGQKELAKYAFGNAENGGVLFVEAPTGIGKTMSTLYPYLKSISNNNDSKIFYLTAKTSGKESAVHALNLLQEKGAEVNYISVTAKEKICLCKGKGCNPEECPYTKNYYNKIQSVLRYALLSTNKFTSNCITELAIENEVCPFELQLDLSLFCDVIVCDYNYMFDPTAYMKRYFDEDCSNYHALIDEAHNLVDRSRSMYSASLSLSLFEKTRKSLRHCNNKKVKSMIKRCQLLFDEFALFEQGSTIVEEFKDEIYKKLNNFINKYQDLAKDKENQIPKEVTDLYIEVNTFLKISELTASNYIKYVEIDENDVIIHIYCLDPSRFIKARTSMIKSALFFSATLSPIDYYIDTLGGNQDTPRLKLPSPFPISNLKLLIAPKISIKYKNREESYGKVVEYIKKFVGCKIGNYFIYVPSYQYLDKIKELINFDDNFDIYFQTNEMSDNDKISFINNFQPNPVKTTIGFCVIGGAFSEGIDLISDRLIGAVIVGVGMPKINFESDQIKEYYNNKEMPGYNYAYTNPGMNKVMQAVGRVIRSETDKGAVLLIDERYTYATYRNLFKSEWKEYELVFSKEQLETKITNFFNK